MPVVVPNGYETKWTENIKDSVEMESLKQIMMGWSSKGWILEEVNKKKNHQISLF